VSWKTAYRSFYYEGAEEPDQLRLDRARTALLVVDIQNTYLSLKDTPEEDARWRPFVRRMRETVIPRNI
jgi:biuret amidohydrolase